MIDVTGIELGPNCCVLVRAGSDPSRTTVTAARAVTPGEWSDDHDSLVELLRSAKRNNRLSSHARVVAWGLPESGASVDLAHLPELGPLVAAGFEIDSIVSPVRALADLVRLRRDSTLGDGIAALSLNTHGAAIAIVSRGEVIASRVFEWPLGRPFSGAHPESLERCLLISQVAPELQHLIDLVRPVHGVTVTSVVACGNLANLRSLSMMLIEEMDLEVETLDSVELLDPEGASRLADLVPTLQLAALAAMPRADDNAVSNDRPRSGSVLATFATLAAMILLSTWAVLAVAGTSPASPFFQGRVEVASVERPPVPDIHAEGTIGRIATETRDLGLGARETRAASPELPRPERPLLSQVDFRAPSPDSSTALRTGLSLSKAEARIPTHQPGAPDPPAITGVLIAGDRRIAIVGGLVVSEGDGIRSLIVKRIDREGVLLQGPGGHEIHVAIRMRKPPPRAP